MKVKDLLRLIKLNQIKPNDDIHFRLSDETSLFTNFDNYNSTDPSEHDIDYVDYGVETIGDTHKNLVLIFDLNDMNEGEDEC